LISRYPLVPVTIPGDVMIASGIYVQDLDVAALPTLVPSIYPKNPVLLSAVPTPTL
jgi:hypothetical protein